MNPRIFKPSLRLSAAVALINNLDESFLSKVLSRICQQLQDNGSAKTSFSNDEKVKFATVLDIHEGDVEALIATLSFFIQQAAFHLVKPATLLEELKLLGFRDDIAAVVTESWASSAKSIVEKLKTQTVALSRLEDVQYSTHLRLASLSASQLKTPVTFLHLRLKDENDAVKTETLELNQSELMDLYNVLETVQSHLDNVM